MILPCGKCRRQVNVGALTEGAQFRCPYTDCGTTNLIVPAAPAQAPSLDLGALAKTAGVVGGLLAVGFGFFKVGQAAFDSWEGAGGDSLEFSQSFKWRFKDEHIQQYGLVCPCCGKGVRRRADLHVDHRRSIKNGGEPWRSNAQIRCYRCNLSKGGNSSWFENLTGR